MKLICLCGWCPPGRDDAEDVVEDAVVTLELARERVAELLRLKRKVRALAAGLGAASAEILFEPAKGEEPDPVACYARPDGWEENADAGNWFEAPAGLDLGRPDPCYAGCKVQVTPAGVTWSVFQATELYDLHVHLPTITWGELEELHKGRNLFAELPDLYTTEAA